MGIAPDANKHVAFKTVGCEEAPITSETPDLALDNLPQELLWTALPKHRSARPFSSWHPCLTLVYNSHLHGFEASLVVVRDSELNGISFLQRSRQLWIAAKPYEQVIRKHA